MNIFFAAAAVCVAYYIVTLFAGGFSVFSLIWPVLGALLGGFGCMKIKGLKLTMILPAPIRWAVFSIFIVCTVLFCVVEGMIIKTGFAGSQDNADYIIILGAQVKGEVPSQVLYLRVMKAVEYLNKNPDTKAIVSGGKGSGEAIPIYRCCRIFISESFLLC
ncbi:MAG: hypothetical protein MRZ59_11355 [Clostridiales bacterium]|nr:hypothetical protein [Clostridiales bacterium]